MCASILTIRLETRSALMNLLVTTYTSPKSLSSLLSFFCRLLSELGFWIPWSSSRAPPPLRSQGSPVPMSPWVSQVWCSSLGAAAACADWGRGGSAAPHIVCPTSCHCAPTSTLPGIGCRSRRRGLPGVNIKAARGEHQSCQG